MRFATLVLLFLVGCSGGPEPKRTPHAVKGSVLVNERPWPNITVVFHPVAPTESGWTRSQGTTDADGTFELSTYRPGDGAPAGEYTVTFTWSDPRMPEDSAADILGGKYRDPRRSRFRVVLPAFATRLEPFRLTR
jgi:hypothetical protein